MTGMNHRERVLTALNHGIPDRCPMQISFTAEFERRLRVDPRLKRQALEKGLSGQEPFFPEQALDQDIIVAWYGTKGWSTTDLSPGEGFYDEWGVKRQAVEYQTRFGTGIYLELVGHPLEVEKNLTSYTPPDPTDPDVYRNCVVALRDYKKDYFIAGATVTTIFEKAWALRGYDRLLVDLIANPGLAEEILEIPYRYNLAIAKKMTAMGVDMIWTGDDVGTQRGMLISPDTWRCFFKERMARFFTELKKINPDLKIAYHSDGNILPIIPDLIEIGLDILNPVQPACMDPALLKRKYGRKLCFWGSIDEQKTLPFGTVQDVRDEVRKRYETIGRHGGLILSPTHNVQPDTPLENFWAMDDGIEEGYPEKRKN